MPEASLTLAGSVTTLRRYYGRPEPPPTSDPFELLLWENVAYLAAPARRLEAFEALRRTVGTSPEAILAADPETLEAITRRGILGPAFAEKLRACAAIAVEGLGGDLGAVVRGPIDKAKRALRRFPSIGEPGAEKILLFAGAAPLLAPESNGLRVLVRLGLVREESSYARTYAAAGRLSEALPQRPKPVQEAHLLLALHGRTLCKRAAPVCEACPLASGCAYASTNRAQPSKRRSKRRPR